MVSVKVQCGVSVVGVEVQCGVSVVSVKVQCSREHSEVMSGHIAHPILAKGFPCSLLHCQSEIWLQQARCIHTLYSLCIHTLHSHSVSTLCVHTLYADCVCTLRMHTTHAHYVS